MMFSKPRITANEVQRQCAEVSIAANRVTRECCAALQHRTRKTHQSSASSLDSGYARGGGSTIFADPMVRPGFRRQSPDCRQLQVDVMELFSELFHNASLGASATDEDLVSAAVPGLVAIVLCGTWPSELQVAPRLDPCASSNNLGGVRSPA